MQFVGLHIGRNRDTLDHADWAGIEPGFHPHDRNTGFFVTSHDCTLNGCGTAPARQERGVNIDTPKRRNIEHGLRQDHAIGDDDDQIRRERRQSGTISFFTKIFRRTHIHAEAFGRDMHG